MKIFILILATTVAFSAATPVSVGDDIKEDDKDGPIDQEKMFLDLEEMDLEFFPNGTVKLSSLDDLLQIYYVKKDIHDLAGNKTSQNFSEEQKDSKNEDRSKRTIFDDDERLPIPNSNLNSLPFCALAEVSNGCTATFIGPNHALTAGRCVYDRTNRRFRSGLRLYRGRNCYRYGTYMTATNLFTVNGYALRGK